ncbi:AAA family ATPase [Vibrio splendidus]|uniref:AAA family ATPase n=1 Tax=Vibrio splendidus TaxID=29497 RepID=UPI000C829CA5|nr:AAA family ATPase [Vibrio splendidus]PMI54367.1 hypothetical protein BCU42_18410 [Vibrio splendidus]
MYVNINTGFALKFKKMTSVVHLPIGVPKFQYSLKNDPNNKLLDPIYNLNDDPKLSQDSYCYYCGSKATVIHKAFLHDGSGFNLWMLSEPTTYYPLCSDCHSSLGFQNMTYLGRSQEVSSSITNIKKLKPYLTVPNCSDYESDFSFEINGELSAKTTSGQNSINKLSLNRPSLINRRKIKINTIRNIFTEEISNLISYPSSFSKISIPIFDEVIDLNFTSQNFDFLFFNSIADCLILKQTSHNELEELNSSLLTKASTKLDVNTVSFTHNFSDYDVPDHISTKVLIDTYELIKKYPEIYNHIQRVYQLILTKNRKDSYRINTKGTSQNLLKLHYELNKIKQQNKIKSNLIFKSNQKINKITFSGIRNFSPGTEVEIGNNKSLVLIGENGVGKSTFLELLQECLGKKQGNLINLIGSGNKSASVIIDYINNINSTTFEQSESKPRISNNNIKFNVVQVSDARITNVEIRKKLNLLVSIQENEDLINYIGSNLVYLLDFPPESKFSINNNVAIINNGLNDIEIETLSSGYKSIFSIYLSSIGHFINNILDSDIDSLASLKTNLDNSIILIDEMELHLHPKFKKNILKKLNTVFPNSLLIITTHDPLVLHSCTEFDKVLVLKNINNKTEIIKEIPDISNYSVEQILTSPVFGLSTINRNVKYGKKIEDYHRALEQSDIDTAESLQNELADSGYFGNTHREYIVNSVLDLYQATRGNFSKRKLLQYLIDQDKNTYNE